MGTERLLERELLGTAVWVPGCWCLGADLMVGERCVCFPRRDAVGGCWEIVSRH